MKSFAKSAWWLLIAWCLVVGSSACLPKVTGRPAWVVTHRHADFPLDQYLVGAGEGAGTDEAEKAASADLGRQVTAILHLDAAKGAAEFLASAKIAASWSSQDGKRHAALAVLDRKILANAGMELAKSLEQRAKEMIAAGDLAMEKEHKPYQALVRYLSACSANAQAGRERQRAAAFLDTEPAKAQAELAGVPQKIDTILSALELRFTQGDGQRLRPDGSFEKPLAVSAEFVQPDRWAPAQGMPLRFQVASGSGDFEALVRTDDSGQAQATVSGLKEAEPPKNQVMIRVDGPKVLEESGIDPKDERFAAWSERLSSIQASASFQAIKQGTYRALLLVPESRSGQPAGTSVLGTQLAAALQGLGYNVLDPGLAPLAALSPAASAEQVAAATKELAEVVVFGRVDAGLLRIVTEGFVFAEAKGTVRVLRTDSAAVLATFEQTVKSAGTDEWNANERALGHFARKAIPVLIEGVKAAVEKK